MKVDPAIRPYYDVSFILCTFVFCERCRREAVYTSPHPPFSDENYYDQAVAMKEQGWVVISGSKFDVLCPDCAKQAATAHQAAHTGARFSKFKFLSRFRSMFHQTRPKKFQ